MDTSQELQEMNRKLTLMLTLLQGNSLDKNDLGMAGTQDDHENRIKRLEDKVKAVQYMLIGMGAPASWGVIQLLIKIFSH